MVILANISQIQLRPTRYRFLIENLQDPSNCFSGSVIVVLGVNREKLDYNILSFIYLGDAVSESTTSVYRDAEWAWYDCRHIWDVGG